MCTVSWSLRKGGGYDLFFNRDERRARPRALLPQREVLASGLERIHPVDAQAGGTWISVNDHGLTACLLNRYSDESGSHANLVAAPIWRTRGEIPLAMTEERGVEAALKRLDEMELSLYRPFYLCLVDAFWGAAIRLWNGEGLEEASVAARFLTTSSFEPRAVKGYRLRLYEALCGPDGDAKRRERFHRDVANPNRAYNPLMEREDAETQCLSRVSVGSGAVCLAHAARDPDSGAFGPEGVWRMELAVDNSSLEDI